MSLLKRITNRAKEIYKRGGTWKGALKKAGAELRGSRSTTKRRKSSSTKKRKHKKSVGVVFPSGVGSVSGGTISGHMASAKKLIADRIGDLERQKFTTRLKVDKRKIQKRISELKRQYRKLK